MNANRDLHPIPLADALRQGLDACVITMGFGQWDATLSAAYHAGWILLEVDENEVPVRAYQKNGPKPPEAGERA
jgi:hypothetical protein